MDVQITQESRVWIDDNQDLLSSLTIRHDSVMSHWLRDYMIAVGCVARIGTEIVGWAAVANGDLGDHELEIGVFVVAKYRKNGIASQLVSALARTIRASRTLRSKPVLYAPGTEAVYTKTLSSHKLVNRADDRFRYQELGPT